MSPMRDTRPRTEGAQEIHLASNLSPPLMSSVFSVKRKASPSSVTEEDAEEGERPYCAIVWSVNHITN